MPLGVAERSQDIVVLQRCIWLASPIEMAFAKGT